jgi:hypothetical protein
MPCYAAEVPTVFVSLNMPNHLIDIPMVKTAINAHNPTPEVIRSLVAKLVGRSPFLVHTTTTSGVARGTRFADPFHLISRTLGFKRLGCDPGVAVCCPRWRWFPLCRRVPRAR